MKYYVRRAFELGPRETLHQALSIFGQWTQTRRRRMFDLHFRKPPDQVALLTRFGLSDDRRLLELKNRKAPEFFVNDDREFYSRRIRDRFPDETRRIVDAADALLDHRCDVLGVPVQFAHSGAPLWNTDFASGFIWDPGTYYRDIRYGDVPGVDVKVPWELSRFQHALPLAQAYRITGDDRYTAAFISQVTDWIASNPCRFGVNWSCTMEAGIRAVNWIWAFYLFRNSELADAPFLRTFLVSLYSHATFIRENLEYCETVIDGRKQRLNSNHYLADLVGLLYITLLFPEFGLNEAKDFAVRELETELFQETYPDGMDYEHSTSYHRLVFEMFLSGFLLLRLNGHSLKPEIVERLCRMGEFVADYLRPDGRAPQLGDNDNGRLHPLSIRDVADHRYLLNVTAMAFGRNDLDRESDAEAAWWLGEIPPDRRQSAARPSAAYSGVYVLKSDATHVVVTAAPVGMRGLGYHSHNDILGFDYWALGTHWLVDPGTGVYTRDASVRNWFRSTAAHNVVRIDGAEMNPFDPGRLFQMTNRADFILHSWRTDDDATVLEAEHTGFRALMVRHKREFRMDRKRDILTITDTIEGGVERLVEWFFHVHPLVKIELGNNSCLFRREDSVLRLELSGDLVDLSLTAGWYSPAYGQRTPAPVLVLKRRAALPVRLQITLSPVSRSS